MNESLEYRATVVTNLKKLWEESRERWFTALCYYEQDHLVEPLRILMEHNYQVYEKHNLELQKQIESPYECICEYIVGGYFSYYQGNHICKE